MEPNLFKKVVVVAHSPQQRVIFSIKVHLLDMGIKVATIIFYLPALDIPRKPLQPQSIRVSVADVAEEKRDASATASARASAAASASATANTRKRGKRRELEKVDLILSHIRVIRRIIVLVIANINAANHIQKNVNRDVVVFSADLIHIPKKVRNQEHVRVI